MSGIRGSFFTRISLAGVVSVTLVGCDQISDRFSMFQGGNNSASGTVQVVERDVEAPEIFEMSAPGVWDGAPSLGGIWVAHPTVVEPMRVIIRNQANDSFVIGSLFYRDEEHTGPGFQVSADAATALGMGLGDQAELQVTALRREETHTPDATPTATFDAPEEQPLPEVDSAATTSAVEQALAGTPQPAATPVTASTSSVDKPYVQIGIFSVEANANRAASQMRTAGLQANIVETQIQGKSFWRVTVGPAQTVNERSAMLGQVRRLGFGDAYAVRN